MISMQILRYHFFLFKVVMFILLLERLLFIYAIKFQWEIVKHVWSDYEW